jgi:predicted ATP-grasp superfamily ATP-dependent carboligase
MRYVQQVPGVVVLGSNSKALGIIRSLGRQGIPAIVVEGQSCSAWFSRHVTRCFSWEGSVERLVVPFARLAHKPQYQEAYA